MTQFDKTDLKILDQLQNDASMSHAEVAERIHLSASQCSRRIQRLAADGVIRGQVTLLDEEALGITVEAYVMVTLASYTPDVVSEFHTRIAAIEAIVDCCALTGNNDYLLRVLTTDLKAFSRLVNGELLGHGDVAAVRSSIVLERIKRTAALPLPRYPTTRHDDARTHPTRNV